MDRIPYVPQPHHSDDLPIIDDAVDWIEWPAVDPHAGCYLPHLGPDGPVDCDGRPL